MKSLALLRWHLRLFDLAGAQKLLEGEPWREIEAQTVHQIEFLALAYRFYREVNSTSEIERIQQKIKSLGDSKDSNFMALKYYLLGRIAAEAQEMEQARDHLRKSLEHSISDEGKCRALTGLAIVEYLESHLDLADFFLRRADIDSLRETETGLVQRLWCAQVTFLKGDLKAALEKTDSLIKTARRVRNLSAWIEGLASEAEIYLMDGNLDRAEISLTYAQNLFPEDYHCRTQNKIDRLQEKLRERQGHQGFDLIEEENQVILVTPDQKKVDMTYQRILLKLLKLLGETPRVPLEKEVICKALWDLPYHPFEVDNKIYVTIRRLRKLIGDSTSQPEYILKREEGYLLNPNLRFTWFQRTYSQQEV
ncbi:MAG: winged helix-turn-helix domain-containing protein [Bdellovibrionales bacterium]|nr:winged helix-turn-helix domain-containing protein [Bdellovibrionales bacterium]